MSIHNGYRRLIIGYKNSDHEEIVKDYIRNKLIGGLLVNKANLDAPEKLRFIKQCHELSDEKLFVFIDQEGGKVQRYFGAYGAYPSAEEISHMQEDKAAEIYNTMAEELSGIGVNVNCAPVVDLNVNQDCPIIAKFGRSYGKDAETVHKCASILVRQHKKYDVMCVYKHFPGHGSSREDSHLGFTDISDTWIDDELLPYKYAIIEELPEMIMTSHVFNRSIDSDLPISLSPTVKTMLRAEMGYRNIVITDDLDMKSISEFYNLNDIFDLTIENTTDFILFSNFWHFKSELPGIYAEYLQGIVQDRNKVGLIEKSIMRIENIS